MRRLQLGLRLSAAPAEMSGGGASVPIASVSALGYRAAYAGESADFQPGDSFEVVRQGYDGSFTSPGGVPTPTLRGDISETFKVRHRCRGPYLDDGAEPVWGDEVALSDYVYATDSVPGMAGANGSTETSPMPTAGWAIYDRVVVGDTLRAQLVAFHRDARHRQGVACVLFTASDGTSSVHALVTSSSRLSPPATGHAFADIREEGFEADIDISALADNSDIVLNAKVFPWIGGAASVRDSAAGSQQYELSPRVYRKNLARFAAPPLVYVSNAGTDAAVDAGGQAGGIAKVSTGAATARAAPFQTVKSAIEALKAATGVTGGFVDGCEVRIMDAVTWSTSPVSGTYSQSAALMITRDPLSADRAAAPLTVSAVVSSRGTWTLFRDIRLAKTANVLSTGMSKVMFDGVDYDSGGFSSPFASATCVHYWVNVTGSTWGSGVWNSGSTTHALIRGCTVLSGPNNAPEACVLIGNRFSGNTLWGMNVTREAAGAIVAFNKFMNITATSTMGVAPGTNFSGLAVVQNVIEYAGSTASVSIVHISADGSAFNCQNLIWHNNTWVGGWNSGRGNMLYDETIGTYRNHRLCRIAASIFNCWTSKSDHFIGANGGADAAESQLHVNSQNILYGVGFDELFHLWPDAAAVGKGYDTPTRRWGHYGPYSYGRNSTFNNSSSVANDPRFAVPAHSVWNGTAVSAGAGNGNYALQPDSPCKAQVVNPRLRFDLAGNPRAAAEDSIGAYA